MKPPACVVDSRHRSTTGGQVVALLEDQKIPSLYPGQGNLINKEIQKLDITIITTCRSTSILLLHLVSYLMLMTK